jgi:hypothetical protein
MYPQWLAIYRSLKGQISFPDTTGKPQSPGPVLEDDALRYPTNALAFPAVTTPAFIAAIPPLLTATENNNWRI